jgi:predicted dienelactone hydrolase
MRGYRLCLAAFGSAICSAASLAQLDGGWLGRERGPYRTGTLLDVWIDEGREESLTAATRDKRHLTIQIWYPASDTGGEPIALYAPSLDSYDEETQQLWRPVASRRTNSHVEPAISQRAPRYPVILYSHGFLMPAFSGTAQTEFLASHGYVVVSIGHTGWDARTEFPDGYRFDGSLPEDPESASDDGLTQIQLYRRSGQRPSLQTAYATGLRDIHFVIDRLEQLNEAADARFYRRLDLASVGGLGFSIGGALYFQTTVSDPRMAAAVNLDGGLNGLAVLADGARKPVLQVVASDNFPTVANGPADAEMEEFFVEVEREMWQMLRLTIGEWAKATVLGTIHPHFSDAFLVAPAPAELADPSNVHATVNRLVLEFFNRHLRHDTATPILSHEEKLEGLTLVTRLAEQGP